MSSLCCKAGANWLAMQEHQEWELWASGLSAAGLTRQSLPAKRSGAGAVTWEVPGVWRIHLSLYVHICCFQIHIQTHAYKKLYIMTVLKIPSLHRNTLLVTHTPDVDRMAKINRSDPQRQDSVSAGTEEGLERGEET